MPAEGAPMNHLPKFVLVIVAAIVASSCGTDSQTTAEIGCLVDPGVDPVEIDSAVDHTGTTITLATHDSFFISDGVFATFTEQTGIEVEQVGQGDAGQLVSTAVLTKDNPVADVMYGIDTTFLCTGIEAGIFLPYEPANGDVVDVALDLDEHNRVTPINYGDVCANYWIDALPGEVPVTLEDLTDPANAAQFVTQNPETSSPGFAFLLATIDRYGDGWEQYWERLVDNDLSVTSGWNDAYNGEFTAGGGDRSIVVSYASSPAAEVLFAEPAVDASPTGVLYDSCFRQVEFAGVLQGTEHPEAAALLIDFMLTNTFQEDIPLNMFVYPASVRAELPKVFVEHAALAPDPITMNPTTISENRADWTARWTEIVLR